MHRRTVLAGGIAAAVGACIPRSVRALSSPASVTARISVPGIPDREAIVSAASASYARYLDVACGEGTVGTVQTAGQDTVLAALLALQEQLELAPLRLRNDTNTPGDYLYSLVGQQAGCGPIGWVFEINGMQPALNTIATEPVLDGDTVVFRLLGSPTDVPHTYWGQIAYTVSAVPNPTDTPVRIMVRGPADDRLAVQVVDIRGRVFATLSNGISGSGEYVWNLQGPRGRVSAGTYFVTLRSPDQILKGPKITVLR